MVNVRPADRAAVARLADILGVLLLVPHRHQPVVGRMDRRTGICSLPVTVEVRVIHATALGSAPRCRFG
jgi:hypothetical protein